MASVKSLKPSYKRASSTQTGTILPRNPNLSIATNPSKPLALLNSSSSFITSFKSHQNFCLHRSVHELKPVKYVPEKGVWPAFSPDAFKVHYYEIYQTHLRKLNDLLIETEWMEEPLDFVVKKSAENTSKVLLFNHAAEAYNHQFFFSGIFPGGRVPSKELQDVVTTQFGSMDNLKRVFADHAKGLFGNGWVWLVTDRRANMQVVTTYNSGTPIVNRELLPLLCLDMWEHAYFTDHQHRIDQYVDAWWEIVNWDFVGRNLARVELVRQE